MSQVTDGPSHIGGEPCRIRHLDQTSRAKLVQQLFPRNKSQKRKQNRQTTAIFSPAYSRTESDQWSDGVLFTNIQTAHRRCSRALLEWILVTLWIGRNNSFRAYSCRWSKWFARIMLVILLTRSFHARFSTGGFLSDVVFGSGFGIFFFFTKIVNVLGWTCPGTSFQSRNRAIAYLSTLPTLSGSHLLTCFSPFPFCLFFSLSSLSSNHDRCLHLPPPPLCYRPMKVLILDRNVFHHSPHRVPIKRWFDNSAVFGK